MWRCSTFAQCREYHIPVALSLDVCRAVKGLQVLVEAHPDLEDWYHLLVLAMGFMVAVEGQTVLERVLKRMLHPPLFVRSLQSDVFVSHDVLQPSNSLLNVPGSCCVCAMQAIAAGQGVEHAH